MNHFETYNGQVLRRGRKYRWSGINEALYTALIWEDRPCKIVDITEDEVHIYDYEDDKIYKYQDRHLSDAQVTFKRMSGFAWLSAGLLKLTR